MTEGHAPDAFNTWDSDYPADFIYPRIGLRLGFAAYSNAARLFSRFRAPLDGVRLGPRTIGAEQVALEVALAGTRLALDFACAGPHTVVGRWRVLEHGEWGLRFWTMPWLQWDVAGARVHWNYCRDSQVLSASTATYSAALVMQGPPLLVTMHESIEHLTNELEGEGYWYLASRADTGAVPALRCNLEEMPELGFALAVVAGGDQVGEAAAQAQAAITAAAANAFNWLPVAVSAQVNAEPSATAADSLAAMRDVVAWNTVYDAVNQRRYTALSRNWSSEKFGGFGLWLDDIFYHALVAGQFDPSLARDNIEAVLAHATPAGNLPCLVTGRDAWVDRSQPPVGSFVVWMLYLRQQDRELLEFSFDALLANHEWWWRSRDGNSNGLVEYGSSAVGDGLYIGTALGARNESSMDNSPTHDEAVFVPGSRTLDCEDVGLNSLLALDGEMLGNCAEALGRSATAKALRERATALKRKIAAQLWDAERGVFANRLWSGRFVRSIAPTSFYPLLAGAATPEQAQRMLDWLRAPEHFGGDIGLPSVSRDDPAYGDNVYWRGRAWPPLNFLTYYGLRRYGFHADADALARTSGAVFHAEWRERRICAENYNADTGAATDQPDTDTFYGWGALMPWLDLARRFDVTPWSGAEVRHDGADFCVGPLTSPCGDVRLRSQSGELSITINDVQQLRSDVLGCYAVQANDDATLRWQIACEPCQPARSVTMQSSAARISVDGKQLAPATGNQLRYSVPDGARDVRIE